MSQRKIKVAAGVIVRVNQVFIARRKEGKLAGFWEFPGGKIEDGETPQEGLARELSEELGIQAEVGECIGTSHFITPELDLKLTAFWVERYLGDIVPVDHDDTRWVRPDELTGFQMAPADLPFFKLIKDRLG